jgi:hypothetical protein
MAPNSTFLASMQKLKNQGLAGNQNPYAPSGLDPQPTDGHIETPVDQGIHVDNPYAPQRDPQPTDGPSALAAYKPPSTGRQILGALVGGFTHNPNLAGAITGDTNLERQKEALGLQQQQAQTELTRQQGQMVTTYGPNGQPMTMPLALAKTYLPALERGTTAQNVAQTGATSREQVAQTGAQSREAVAQTNKRFIPVEGVGLFDAQSRQVIPGTSQAITITPEIAKDYSLPDDFLGKPMKLSDLNAFRFQNVPEMTAQGPIIINRNQATAKPVTGPQGQHYAPPGLAEPMQVGDPNNPGNTTIVPKGQAFGMQGTSSASVQVPRQAEKSAVPTNIGNQHVAFNTMIQHANLLRQAAQALGNGDTQALNGLTNAFKNQFGYTGPITAQAIADAYNGEVTSVLNKGHITDKDLAKSAQTVDPRKQNLAQIDSVLGAYQNLAQSKMNMLDQQAQSAVRSSQPGQQNSPKIYHYDSQGNRQ